ncbi:MAG TPA: hypothetical protein VMT17_20410 [Anaeromyxobacteraceae bacterium]|nr:hypothetical protein [Anaeromyxobacteraceae bacterium]
MAQGEGTVATDGAPKKGSILGAALWMLVLSLLLFWIPVLGPLAAGVVGGRKAGDAGRAVLAALLPAILAAILFFFLGTALTGIPLLGFVAGLGAGALVAAHVGPLLLGAIIGAVL